MSICCGYCHVENIDKTMWFNCISVETTVSLSKQQLMPTITVLRHHLSLYMTSPQLILVAIHMSSIKLLFNTLALRQNGCNFTDDIFKCIFFNENVFWLSFNWILFLINSIPALVRLFGPKPVPEQMMVSLLTHICVTRPQYVKVAPLLRMTEQLEEAVWMANNILVSKWENICLSENVWQTCHIVVPNSVVNVLYLITKQAACLYQYLIVYESRYRPEPAATWLWSIC